MDIVFISALTILAFGFGNLAVLGWLAAAAAPILIHLWMRHTHRETRWAAMLFLREAIKRNARRLQLQQWLLLAIRTLVLLLLVLAAAKPYLSGWSVLSGAPRTHHMLVLDCSMSMRYSAGSESVFARAKRLAQQVLDESAAGDVFSLHAMDDSHRSDEPSLICPPTTDARRVGGILAALEPGYSSATLADSLASLGEVATTARDNYPDLAAEQVLFFTDLASHTWGPATEQGSTSEQQNVVEQLRQLADRSKLTVMDVAVEKPATLSIGKLRLPGGLATTVAPTTVECEVANQNDQPVKDLLVQLLTDGVIVGEQRVSLAAAARSPVTFQANLPDAGWRSLTVRISGDELAADDQAYLAVNVRKQMRALLVEGAPKAAKYLRHALDPGGDKTSPIAVTVAPESAMVDTSLNDFDCVFLCNVARIASDEQGLLDRYVRQGGLLVLFMGDRVLPDVYNRLLVAKPYMDANPLKMTPLLQPGRSLQQETQQEESTPISLVQSVAKVPTDTTLLPASIGDVMSSNTVGVLPLDYRHPIAEAFRGSERAGLLSTPVWRFFDLQPTADARVVLSLPSGHPLLVTAKRGRGVVAMFATAASLDTIDSATGQPWTMLPAWPSFLPVVRELVAYGLSESHKLTSRTVGEPLGGMLPSSWSETAVRITRPDGRRDSVPVMRTERGVEWSYASTDLPGIYSVVPAGVASSSDATPIMQLAVNIPPEESNLAQVDSAKLPPGLNVRASTEAQASQLDELLSGASLHRGLLYAVLALMLVESVMAWAFSGRVA